MSTNESGRIDPTGWDDITEPAIDAAYLASLDVASDGARGWAMVGDGGHPDVRVPYRLSVEAGVPIEMIDASGMVS